MAAFVGQVVQIPPMYSAVKVDGRKLYEYARAGQEVERPKRTIEINSFERTSPLVAEGDLVRFTFRVKCGKGTYVRTLSVELGAKLGYASHMSKLERTGSAGLTLDDALTLAEISDLVEKEDFSFLRPLELGIGDLPTVELTSEQVTEVSFGRRISLNSRADLLAAFYQGKLVAILERRDDLYKPRKVML